MTSAEDAPSGAAVAATQGKPQISSEFQESLKSFIKRGTSSSRKERHHVLRELNRIWNSEATGISEGPLNAILFNIGICIPRYLGDPISCHELLTLIRQILEKSNNGSYGAFFTLLTGVADSLGLEEPSKYSKKMARFTLRISVLLEGKIEKGTTEWKSLVDVQSRLLYVALNTARRSEENIVYKIMRQSFSLSEEVLRYLTREEASLVSAGYLKLVALLALRKGNDVLLKEVKMLPEIVGVVTHFVRWTFSSKVPAPTSFLSLSQTGFLRLLDQSTFKDNLLSPMVKSMLRNPEVVLPAVIAVLKGVTIDLSPFSLDIGKQLATQLHSKVEASRKLSVEAVKHLAQQCSDTAAVDELVTHFFAVLNGSEGKVTLAAERMDVLSGIGNLSQQPRSDLQTSADRLTTLFTAAVSGEVHEAVAVHAISMFSLWAVKFTKIPSPFLAVVKSIPSLKSSAIRTAYLGCLAVMVKETSDVTTDVTSVLVKTVEGAAVKAGDSSLALEALPAVSLLLLLQEGGGHSVWNVVVDGGKQLWTSEKFLLGCSVESLKVLSVFLERLFVLHFNRLKPETVQLYVRAFAFVLLRSRQAERRGALMSWKKVIAVHRLGMLSEQLVGWLKVALVKLKGMEGHMDKEGGEVGRVQNVAKNAVVVLTELVESYVELSFPVEEKGRLVVECLLVASEAGVASLRPTLWISLLQRFRHDSIFPDKLVADHVEEIWQKVQKEDVLEEDVLRRAIETVIAFPTSITVVRLLENVKKELYAQEIRMVTLEDCLVFQSPVGTLFDKSVLETESDTTKGNIKRESKAYSYKDQLAEIELRKELEEKRKAKAMGGGVGGGVGGVGGKDASLTPKQKEIVTKQIQKEDAVRLNVAKVFRKIERPFLVLNAMLKGNPDCFRSYLSEVIAIVSPLLHVPLTAPSACATWILMSHCLHQHLKAGGIAKSLALVTLRVLEPACPLPKEWTRDPLSKSVEKVIHGILSSMEKSEGEGGEGGDGGEGGEVNGVGEGNFTPSGGGGSRGEEGSVTVSDMCFALPLIGVVVNEAQGKKVGVGESVAVEAFRIVCKVMQLCAKEKGDVTGGNDLDSEIAEMDENNPAFLPLDSVLEMLIEVGQSGKARFEADACVAIGHFAVALTRVSDDDLELEKKIIHRLLKVLLSSKMSLRIGAVQALNTLKEKVKRFNVVKEERLTLEKRLFIAAYDQEDPKVAEFALDLFRDLDLQPSSELLLAVVEDVTFLKEFVRNSAAAALGALLPLFPDRTGDVLHRLLEKYNQNVEDSKPRLDKFGRPTTDQQIDSWPARRGIAAALIHITPCLGEESFLRDTMTFLLQRPCALRDEKTSVRNDMLEVAVVLVRCHGKKHVGELLAKLEEFLAEAPKTADYDVVRQSAIVIMGNLARHLEDGHVKIRPVVHQLLAALATPSEEVQKAVSACIAPLVVGIEEDVKGVVPSLLHVLYESESYAHRRGAAYGLAGVFKGLGIMSLKEYDIMLTIMNGLQEKKNAQKKESSLLAISMLSMGLGKVFEPFVVQAIPFVLQSIGDGNIHVRQAAEEASKGAMSQLSGPGVKLVLPALLKGLHEDAWRSKSAAIEMLGDMAFCAPRQLSSSLPIVVPNLIETLGDSHTKVQESAVSALKKIASVIKNPEVVGLVPNILTALQDPAKKTTSCLKTILQTQFIHIIDAPSLALLMPVIRRAIYDRGTENRKLSAQIMASLYNLADQKDLLPYMEGILPGLKNCLLDPAPEVRLCAAKAIAALIQGTGEAGFDQLKEWLYAKLVSDSNSVDRSGAAQGLAEAVGVLGVAKLRSLMPGYLDVILNEKTPSYVRDGYLLVFVYLPAVFGQEFSSFISDVIPALLIGLADDAEYVRETALQCGQRIVTFFADSAIELLLPQLEVGMFDENWRIRFASVQLLGDLLYKISGASGKHTTAGLDEDENFGTDQSHAAILERLGGSHRNRVLAGLYISRSDNALVVRQAALHVWKVIVTNTPKTLREILPELFEILLDALASDVEERRQVAAKTLGELVRKLGERILPEIIPILQDGLKSGVDEHREGVCVGLMEIISSSNKETVVMYCDILEPTLTKALMDKYPGVRRAAADAFCMLDSVVGHKILDDILPVLFDKVMDPVDGDNALDGLQQIMARRSRIVLPYLIPRLTTPPVNTKTLALLTAVAGEALSKHLGKVLPSLLASLQAKIGTPEEETEIGYCRSVMLSVDDEVGVATLVDTLMTGAQTEKNRLAAITLLDLFYANTKVDVRSFFISTIRQLIRLYMQDDPVLIKKVASVIGTLIKKTPTDVVYDNVAALRTAIRAVHMELKVPCIPGFCLPDGAAVFIPMLRDALLSVAADEKEVVGQTIADLVRLSNQAGLRSSVVTITGPIIRILGDRYAPSVRAVMLEALNCLIEKCTILIKPFVPQIQTTVSRALSDPTRSVRVKAGNVAASIAPMHPRLETLANDLLEVAKNNADLSTKETALRSLRALLAAAGAKLSVQYRSDVILVTSRYLDSEENELKNAAAGCLGAIVRFMEGDELAAILKNQIFDMSNADWSLQHGHCLALGAALKEAGDKMVSEVYADQTMDVILKHHTSDRVPVVVTSTRCMGLYLLHQRKMKQPLNKKLLIVLAKSFNHAATEVKQRVAEICSHLAVGAPEPLDISELKILVPQIVNGTKEKNTAVRYDSEMALADVLALRKDESLLEACKAAMDVGARESLQNARKSVSKSVMQSVTKLEELDETLPKF